MAHSLFNKYLEDQITVCHQRMKSLCHNWGILEGAGPRVIEAMVREEAEPMQRLLNKMDRQKHPAGKGPT